MAESVTVAVPYDAVPVGVVVLRHPRRPPRLRQFLLFHRALILSTTAFLLFLSVGYLLFPADPVIQISRIIPKRIKINTSPSLAIDLSFSLVIRVWNPNFFSVDYDSLVVSVDYRDMELGFVKSESGEIKARGVSHVNATLDLRGIQMIRDAFYLIRDLSRGVIPFETVSTIEGHVGLRPLRFSIKSKVECEVNLNVSEQTMAHQNCYPDLAVPYSSQ